MTTQARQRVLVGTGRTVVPAAAPMVWAALLDPAVLATLIPGAERVEQTAPGCYRAVLSLGVGPFRSRYTVTLSLSALDPSRSLDLRGQSEGGLGSGHATGRVTLAEHAPGHTTITWRYEGAVFGPVTLAGGTLLRSASRLFVGRFFATLARAAFSPATAPACAPCRP